MHKLISTASLLALALAAPAFAQDAREKTDDPIVVTATRTQARAANLPADIEIIDAETLRTQGALTLDAALEDVAGLAIVRSGPVGQQASIFSGGANSQHTLVLFDGVRINDPSSPAAGFDAGQDLLAGVSRIEIVQGPMSALYGSDAIGGIVNMIARHGGEGPLNARLDVAGGSFDTLTAQAGIDGALGAFRYALGLEAYGTEGYDIVPARMPTHTGDRDGASLTTITAMFDLALADAFALDLLLRRREAQADFDAFPFDLGTFQEFRADDSDLEIARNDLDLARLGATWDVSQALSLRANAGVVRTDRAQADGGVVTDVFEGERTFAELTGTITLGAIEAVAGITTEGEDIDAIQFGAPIAASQKHDAAFLSATAHFDYADLTGAMRVDDYDGFGTQTTWRLGVSVPLGDAARAYASYGTSFRAPTLYERFVFFGNPDLAPEEGESWEIGADARFALFGQTDGLELGLVYRRSDLTDMIDFGPGFTYANIDEAELESAEARIALRPFDWLTAKIAYTHTGATDATTGEALLRRPDAQWSASLAGEWGVFRAKLAWRRVGDRADFIYGDDSFFIGRGETPGYDLVRISASWDVAAGVSLYASAENVLDETYEPVNAFAGAPRSVLIGVRVTR